MVPIDEEDFARDPSFLLFELRPAFAVLHRGGGSGGGFHAGGDPEETGGAAGSGGSACGGRGVAVFWIRRIPSVREAARLTVESQPFDSWKQRALDEKSAWGSIEALRALTEACPKAEAADLSPHICQEIVLFRVDEMNESQQLEVLQLTRAVFSRLGCWCRQRSGHISLTCVHIFLVRSPPGCGRKRRRWWIFCRRRRSREGALRARLMKTAAPW